MRVNTKTLSRFYFAIQSHYEKSNQSVFELRLRRWCTCYFCFPLYIIIPITVVVMPSKQDQCLVSNNELQTDYLARDVEELVCEIKENLRLKAKPQRTQARRPSPYNKSDRMAARKDPPAPPAIEDPYEMLQHLLDSNSLVAEAVRRLQEGLSPKQRIFYEDEDEFPLLNCPLGV